ncbi:MRG domain-containing protein [Ditylenchus destructor]|uniref:MRG domain-containing protein n=1 Tax=Ditylenchus destructor TaxID=166010 RepID=A0AAD4N7T1_9BILA|nr:MRG domain-containing protein [Ditylenchus destructor]
MPLSPMERNKRRKHSDQSNNSNALSSNATEGADVVGTDSSQVCNIEPKWKVGEKILCQWTPDNPAIKYEARVVEVITYDDQPSYKLRFVGEVNDRRPEIPHSLALEYFSPATPENKKKVKEAIAQFRKSGGSSKEVNSKIKKSPKQKVDKGCGKESEEKKRFTGISAPRKKVSSINAARAEGKTNEEVVEEAGGEKENAARAEGKTNEEVVEEAGDEKENAARVEGKTNEEVVEEAGDEKENAARVEGKTNEEVVEEAGDEKENAARVEGKTNEEVVEEAGDEKENAARVEGKTNEEVVEEAGDEKENAARADGKTNEEVVEEAAPRKKRTSMNAAHAEPIPEAAEERSPEEDLPGAAGQQSPVPSEDVKGLRRKSASVSNHNRRFSKEEPGNGTEATVIQPAVSQVLVESTITGSMEEPANGSAAACTGIEQITLTDSADANDISNDANLSQPVSAKRTSGRKRTKKSTNGEQTHKMSENIHFADAPANHNSQLAIIDEPGSSNQKVRKRRRSNIDRESQPVAVDKNDELIAVPSPPIPFFAPEEEIQSAAPEPIVLPAKLKNVLAADKRQAEEHFLPSIPARFTIEKIMETFCKRHSQEEKYRVFGKELLALFNSRFEKDAMSTFESPLHQDIRSNVGYYFYGLERFMPAYLKNANKQKRGPSEMSDMFGLPHLLRFLTKFHETVRRRMDKSTNLLLCIDDFVQFLDKFQDLYFDESKDYYPAAMGYLKRAIMLDPLPYFY